MFIRQVVGVTFAGKLRRERCSAFHADFLVSRRVRILVRRADRTALSFHNSGILSAEVLRRDPVRGRTDAVIDATHTRKRVPEWNVHREQHIRRPTQVVEVVSQGRSHTGLLKR